MPQIEPRLLQGFFDYLPEEMKLRRYVTSVWREIFEKYGYGQLETPCLEYADILLGKYGEEEKLIYHFKDHGDRHVALRYDQTVPLARVVAQHQDKIKLPFKRYEINRVWRADAARRGRKREFYQCDIDIVGTRSLLADSEILFVLDEGFKRFKLPKHTINLSHRKMLQSFLATIGLEDKFFIEVNRSVDKLDKVGISGVEEELKSRNVPVKSILKILEFVSLEGTNDEILTFLKKEMKDSVEGLKSLAELQEIISYLNVYGVSKDSYLITPSLVRGLDYYTGAVFEVKIPEFGASAIAGGGRFDNLCGMFTDRDIPGVGVAVGFERLCLILQENNIMPDKEFGTKVLVSIFNEDLLNESLKIAKTIREQGINTEIYLENKDNLKKQFQYADRNNIPYVVIIGPDEAKKNKVVLKDMKKGEQRELAVGEIINRIK